MREVEVLRPGEDERTRQADATRAARRAIPLLPKRMPPPRRGRAPADRPKVVMLEELRMRSAWHPLIGYAWVLVVAVGLLLGLTLGQHLIQPWR
jgi:hypothetical protein